MADLWTTRTRIFADKVTRTQRFDKKKLMRELLDIDTLPPLNPFNPGRIGRLNFYVFFIIYLFF